ncbi:Urease accessory protein UreH [Paenibacillus plantiphilus]|uniref:Urease accessory protein UreD n=1 Tax=Paenibacillus plantiphilus TaxID=2905650 RepID=A0ABN8G8D5_9BACL|nr:urease accessory protein UreD [Paenibacillus plantiphilus]CAH1202600.1 Urease accessory protein UreH [Paenibacillus plantiphilus]
MVSKYHTAPIKIAKAFPLGSAAGVMVMDVSPGLLSGDRYELEWKAGEKAHVYMTNQSFTKVHPCADTIHGGASIMQKFVLGEGAIVESMPEPIMLYRDAAFLNETEVRLAAGAVWMQAEVLCPGRTLRGERFQYRSYRSRFRVFYENELIYAQNGRIEPALQLLTSPGCLGEMTHTGTFHAFGAGITTEHIVAVRHTLAELPQWNGHSIVAGVTAAHKLGIAVMAAGTAAWPIQEALRSAWQSLRVSIAGLPPLQLQGDSQFPT